MHTLASHHVEPNFEPYHHNHLLDPFCYIILTRCYLNNNNDRDLYGIIIIIFILISILIITCKHTNSLSCHWLLYPGCIKYSYSFSFVANENYYGQNILQLTSYNSTSYY